MIDEIKELQIKSLKLYFFGKPLHSATRSLIVPILWMAPLWKNLKGEGMLNELRKPR